MKLKWYDLLGLFAPVYLTGIFVWVYFVGANNNWIVTLRMNDYGEGLAEIILVSICFIWSVVTYIRLFRVWGKQCRGQ